MKQQILDLLNQAIALVQALPEPGNEIEQLQLQIIALQAQVSGLEGNVSSLSAEVAAKQAKIDNAISALQA